MNYTAQAQIQGRKFLKELFAVINIEKIQAAQNINDYIKTNLKKVLGENPLQNREVLRTTAEIVAVLKLPENKKEDNIFKIAAAQPALNKEERNELKELIARSTALSQTQKLD